MADEKIAQHGAGGIEHVHQDVEAERSTHKIAISQAQAATEKEHRMTLLEGIRTYPKAIAWSMVISLCIVMEAFDVCLLPNFYALPQFQDTFGTIRSDGKNQISAVWQAGLSNGQACGQIIGLVINGFVTERFGYRYTIVVCMILVAAWTSLYFTATSLTQLLVGYILSGIPWGIFQTLTISYASEVCPVPLRGYLTTWVNSCWGIGQLLGVGSVKGASHWNDKRAFRVPYSLQWIWPLPLSIAVWLAPESPWWLVRRGRIDDAKKSLRRLTSRKQERDFDVDETVAMIAHTTALEQQITAGATYLDCFRGTNLRRTEIVCMTWAIQNLCGNSFAGYAAYFLEQAGLDSSRALDFVLGKAGINVVGVFGAWSLISLGIGRRSLYLYGLCGLFCMLMILGFLGLAPDRNSAALATGVIMLLWACCYQLTVGTVCYSLVGELSTRRLQVKTIALGRATYIVIAIICNVLTPYMFNPTEWNWQNFAGFFWAGATFLAAIYTFFRIPEPTGRTYAELDILFERGISARQFKQTDVDAFEETVQGGAIEEYKQKLDVEGVGKDITQGRLPQCAVHSRCVASPVNDTEHYTNTI